MAVLKLIKDSSVYKPVVERFGICAEFEDRRIFEDCKRPCIPKDKQRKELFRFKLSEFVTDNCCPKKPEFGVKKHKVKDCKPCGNL